MRVFKCDPFPLAPPCFQEHPLRGAHHASAFIGSGPPSNGSLRPSLPVVFFLGFSANLQQRRFLLSRSLPFFFSSPPPLFATFFAIFFLPRQPTAVPFQKSSSLSISELQWLPLLLAAFSAGFFCARKRHNEIDLVDPFFCVPLDGFRPFTK